MKIAAVYSDFYPEISNGLLDGCRDVARNAKIKLKEFRVFGSLEIPLKIKQLLNKDFDGFVALGCIVKGQTLSNEIISYTIFDALMRLSLDFEVPIGVGVLSVKNLKQAKKRSSGRLNRGSEAMDAVLFSLKT